MRPFITAVAVCIFISSCKKDETTLTPITPPTPTTMYFPPIGSDTWETVSAQSLGWDVTKLNEAVDYAGTKNTYGLIILYKGRIVTEKYWNNWTMNTVYYIASAGKSVTAFLAGIAQQEGQLNINNKTSTYLGTGWTSAPLAKENLITVKHQLTMTTGLEYNVPDDDCITPACLTYKADAGSFWYYYNAPYRLMQDVIASATSTNYNTYTKTKLADKIGMKNYTWFNYVLWLNSRDMARFGLLTLNKGTWNGNTLMTDQAYFNAMTNTSQNHNQSYGYLWWLNGKSSFMVPTLTLVFPGALNPAAPADMIAALGKGDKKIYVIPSKDLVVIRHGDDTGDAVLGPSSFDNNFWAKLMLAVK
ncbi:MAG TPA: serine hydrolase [Ferruginibacter sp.]|nr:serine hydrolase [Ferruginibacter sp.]